MSETAEAHAVQARAPPGFWKKYWSQYKNLTKCDIAIKGVAISCAVGTFLLSVAGISSDVKNVVSWTTALISVGALLQVAHGKVAGRGESDSLAAAIE